MATKKAAEITVPELHDETDGTDEPDEHGLTLASSRSWESSKPPCTIRDIHLQCVKLVKQQV